MIFENFARKGWFCCPWPKFQCLFFIFYFYVPQPITVSRMMSSPEVKKYSSHETPDMTTWDALCVCACVCVLLAANAQVKMLKWWSKSRSSSKPWWGFYYFFSFSGYKSIVNRDMHPTKIVICVQFTIFNLAFALQYSPYWSHAFYTFWLEKILLTGLRLWEILKIIIAK